MIPARLAAFYGAIFFVIGFMLPFWPLWMQARGLTPQEIGLIIGAGMLMKVIANPAIAVYADRTGTRRGPLVLLSIFATLLFSIFLQADSFLSILFITMAFFLFWSPLMPLTETLTMHYNKSGILDYGRVRLWGSVTFIFAAWGGGWVLTGHGEELIYWIILAGTVSVSICALLLPDGRLVPSRWKHSAYPLISVIKDRTFLCFILATSLIQTSHVIFYAFGTIHWRKAGLSELTIGWLWAEGVIAEVVLFVWGRHVATAIGPARLIGLAGLAGLVRWWGTSITDALPALVLLQILHGATFGAAHIGAIHFIAQRMDESMSATAQSVYAAAVGGIGFSFASLFSGYLYAQYGSGAYLPMAVMAGTGGIIAFLIKPR